MKTYLEAAATFVRVNAVAIVFGLMLLSGAPVFAQEDPPGLTVTEVVSATDFTAAISNVGSTVSTVIKAAIGLSLGIFIVRFLYGVVKGFVRK